MDTQVGIRLCMMLEGTIQQCCFSSSTDCPRLCLILVKADNVVDKMQTIAHCLLNGNQRKFREVTLRMSTVTL